MKLGVFSISIISSDWAKESRDFRKRQHSAAVVIENGFIVKCFSSLLKESFLSKVSEIKGNQLEPWLAILVHQSFSLAISLKAKQKYHGTTWGPDLDYTRWWVVTLTSGPGLFFLLASFSIPFHYSISQSALPTSTWAHFSTASVFPVQYSLFRIAAHSVKIQYLYIHSSMQKPWLIYFTKKIGNSMWKYNI